MKPVAKAYRDHVPDAVQTGVHNVVQNLKEPAVAVNDLLQGNVGNAWQSVQRLTVNSTIGVAGIRRRRGEMGTAAAQGGFRPDPRRLGRRRRPLHPAAFARSVKSARRGGDRRRPGAQSADFCRRRARRPMPASPPAAPMPSTSGREHLEDLDALERNSLDYYAALRSVYRQHREAEINAAKGPPEGARRHLLPQYQLADTTCRAAAMSVAAKICGLIERGRRSRRRSPGGAAYLGFVFYPPSPRAVTRGQAARAVCRGAVRRCAGSGSSSTPTTMRSRAVLAAAPIDLLQFHGGESPERIADAEGSLRPAGHEGDRRSPGRRTCSPPLATRRSPTCCCSTPSRRAGPTHCRAATASPSTGRLIAGRSWRRHGCCRAADRRAAARGGAHFRRRRGRCVLRRREPPHGEEGSRQDQLRFSPPRPRALVPHGNSEEGLSFSAGSAKEMAR